MRRETTTRAGQIGSVGDPRLPHLVTGGTLKRLVHRLPATEVPARVHPREMDREVVDRPGADEGPHVRLCTPLPSGLGPSRQRRRGIGTESFGEVVPDRRDEPRKTRAAGIGRRTIQRIHRPDSRRGVPATSLESQGMQEHDRRLLIRRRFDQRERRLDHVGHVERDEHLHHASIRRELSGGIDGFEHLDDPIPMLRLQRTMPSDEKPEHACETEPTVRAVVLEHHFLDPAQGPERIRTVADPHHRDRRLPTSTCRGRVQQHRDDVVVGLGETAGLAVAGRDQGAFDADSRRIPNRRVRIAEGVDQRLPVEGLRVSM